MVVQHNLTAMNSNRMLGITQGTLSKSTEKLSSFDITKRYLCIEQDDKDKIYRSILI